MNRLLKSRANERSGCFTELTTAIDRAQKLAWKLGVAEGDCAEAKRLYGRLEAIRLEVDELRFARRTEVREDAVRGWIYAELSKTGTTARA